uniref:Acidic leucine-rich nuclear phosphoprotein 32 family member A-like n=1 Tax=Dermatophagoides pteronyssinus TaxID=6956 RepID=A0A6P6XMC5_DERPT|nr:acidic leucine-rich nuclear phosphoprotein 32 family member A-like [Dermatophagoides pteronyssinus]
MAGNKVESYSFIEKLIPLTKLKELDLDANPICQNATATQNFVSKVFGILKTLKVVNMYDNENQQINDSEETDSNNSDDVYGEFGNEDDESDELYVEESGGNSLVDDMEDDSLLLDSELEKIDSNFEDSDYEYNSDEENKKTSERITLSV